MSPSKMSPWVHDKKRREWERHSRRWNAQVYWNGKEWRIVVWRTRDSGEIVEMWASTRIGAMRHATELLKERVM